MPARADETRKERQQRAVAAMLDAVRAESAKGDISPGETVSACFVLGLTVARVHGASLSACRELFEAAFVACAPTPAHPARRR